MRAGRHVSGLFKKMSIIEQTCNAAKGNIMFFGTDTSVDTQRMLYKTVRAFQQTLYLRKNFIYLTLQSASWHNFNQWFQFCNRLTYMLPQAISTSQLPARMLYGRIISIFWRMRYYHDFDIATSFFVDSVSGAFRFFVRQETSRIYLSSEPAEDVKSIAAYGAITGSVGVDASLRMFLKKTLVNYGHSRRART